MVCSDSLHCWDEDLMRVLSTYCQGWYVDAFDDDAGGVRLYKAARKTPQWSWAQDLEYYPGYEEEFVKNLPPEIIQEVLRQYQK